MRMAVMGSCIRITFGRNVGERLGDVTLLEEMCHWGQTSWFQRLELFLVSLSLPLICGSRCELSAVPIATPFLHHHEF